MIVCGNELEGQEIDFQFKRCGCEGFGERLSTIEADGIESQINQDTSSGLQTSADSCFSTSEGFDDSSIIVPSYTFEDTQGKDSINIRQPTNKGNREHTQTTAAEKVEIHTPLPLGAVTSKMASSDSEQATLTTNMISNLPVTEPEAVKIDFAPFKQAANLKTSLNEDNAVKSAVPFVSNNKAEPSSSSLEAQPSTTVQQHFSGASELAKNWVSFGDEGSSNLSQQNTDSSVTSANTSQTGNGQTTKTTLTNHNSTASNTTNRTLNTVSSQAEVKNASVVPPVSFTSEELDFLASKSWIKFDDGIKTANGKQQPEGIQQQTSSSAGEEWVSFVDSSGADRKALDLLELDVGVKPAVSNAPSPNPFLRATSKSGSNPFQPSTTNPFQPDNVHQSSVVAKTEGPILSSTPQTVAKPFLVSESVKTTHSDSTSGKQTASNATLVLSSVNNQLPISDSGEHTTLENGKLILEEKLVINGSWSMLLRFPDKKRKIGSRTWKPVVVKLEGTTLQIFEEYELSAPFREIPLQAYFVMTTPKLQFFEHGAKVHTVKLEYVKYTEGRSLRHRKAVEHIAQGTPIIKIATPSHTVMRELLQSFNNALRHLPAYRDRGITYHNDEVFVDVDDITCVLLSGDGTILHKNAKVIIKLRAFLTGDPECQLVLNDMVVREREEARLRGELKPQRVHHWVKLQQCDFHKCVDVTSFEQSHSIMFHPLDACTFELMRFPVDHKKPLPLLVKARLNIHSEQRVELKAEIQVCQEAKMAKYVRSNVVFRFPIPESWVPLFRTSKVLRGEKSIKSSKGRHAAGIKSRLKHSKCSIGVSLGKAMYEPEYGSVVWRIDQLPYIHSRIPADAPQTLSIVLDLPPGMEFPESYKPVAELEYEVAYVLVSDTTVIAVKVSNQNIPEKWVCYRAEYFYNVNIDISKPSSGPVRDVGCIQQ